MDFDITAAADAVELFSGPGEVRSLARGLDWSRTAMGPTVGWSPAVRTLARSIFDSPYPICLWSGPHYALLYNDAYRRILAAKHPAALGQPGSVVWAEIWDQLKPQFDGVRAGGEPIYFEDAPFVMARLEGGGTETAWFNYSLSALRDEDGSVAAILNITPETTAKVLVEQRLRDAAARREALLELDDRLRDVADVADLSFSASELLGMTLGAARVGYAAVDAEAGTNRVERTWGIPGFADVSGDHDFKNYGSFIDDLRRGEPVANADVELDERTRDNAAAFGALGIRAHLDVPVFEHGRIVAIMFAHAATPRAWTGDEIAFVRDFAERTHIAITRRQAEAALRASEEFARRVLESSVDCIKVLDLDARVEFLSEGGMCLMEVDDFPAIEGACWPDLWSGDEHAKAVAAVEEARRGGIGRFQGFATTMKGSRRWWDVAVTPISGADGRPAKLLSVSRDITEQREAAERLRELNADLERKVTERALGRSRTWTVSPEIMGVINADGYFEQSNPAWAAVLGWTEEEVARAVFFDFVHPDDLARTKAAWADATERELPALRFENRYRHKEGGWRWLSWVAVPDDGKVYCSARDITAEKEQAAELAKRTAERDRIWEASPDLMLVIDFEGYFRRINPAWTTVLGYAPDELIDQHVNAFVVSEDHDETTDAYELAAAGGLPVIVNRYRHKDGSTRWISWTAAPAGDLTYATGRDITAQKEREAELQAAQEALRQSQKMEAMGSLTGGVAHDFNNLLTPIIGSLDMLVRKGVGSERERRLIDGALQSAERAKTLVQRLLAFARRQPLQPVAVDVGRLVDGMAGLIGSTLGPTIDVRVDLAGDLPPARTDPNQLEMALLNLAVNARDAMPDGGELVISAKRETVRGIHAAGLKPGHYVRLCVTDDGVGMDEATLARAIEPFFSTKGIGKGTGLGLSMVHGLAAQLGGGLTIESRPGRGTSIELWLPISGTVVGDDADAATAPSGQIGRGKALLVDDEELVRMSTADMLIDLGFEVVEAGSAEEALALINAGTVPDLLVTDHLMPGMTGAELAQEARVLKPALPVLLVSGYAEVEGIAPGLPRLTKPFRNAELAASLATLIPALS